MRFVSAFSTLGNRQTKCLDSKLRPDSVKSARLYSGDLSTVLVLFKRVRFKGADLKLLRILLLEPNSSLAVLRLRSIFRSVWTWFPPKLKTLSLRLLAEEGATRQSGFGSISAAPSQISSITFQSGSSTAISVALYLPQFHRIPENDAFWGEGFTEWRNVQRARPLFEGHRQPKIPTELGYYDLSDPGKVFEKQVELARNHGIDAFGFHYYWFDGKPVMDGPIENWFRNKSLDLHFMINWANENWTRRWDGLENQVLLRQNHSPADDIKFIAHVSRYFADPRYVRLNGRPVLMIYRPMLFPDPTSTIQRFRTWFKQNRGGELHITIGLSFEQINPFEIGADSAVEYPPNQIPLSEASSEKSSVIAGFGGRIHALNDLATASAQVVEGYGLRFKTVVPGWDNTPRKMLNGSVYDGFQAVKFAEWSEQMTLSALTQEPRGTDKLIFINAWNEWAEGAFLEPDLESGKSKLRAFATGNRRAKELAELTLDSRSSFITVVTHDCNQSGAQQLALSMARSLSSDFGLKVQVLSLGGGPLEKEFAAVSHSFEIIDQESFISLRSAALTLKGSVAIVNSAASFSILDHLSAVGIKAVTLVHELETYLKPINDRGGLESIIRQSHKIVFPHEHVESRFSKFVRTPPDKSEIFHQGTYRKVTRESDEDRNLSREKLGMSLSDKIVLASGYGDSRKGFDLFLRLAERVVESSSNYLFVWVGEVENARLLSSISKATQSRVKLLGHMDDPKDAYLAADSFVLTSRVDPFPSVVMEAIQAGLAVYAFDCGGASNLIAEYGGYTCPVGDLESLSDAILSGAAQHKPPRKHQQTPELIQLLDNSIFSMRRYLHHILDLLGASYPKVTAVVPVHNQSRWVRETLESIEKQEVPVLEILIFDDCSTDDTLRVLRKFAAESQIQTRIFSSPTNTGNPAWSWIHAARIARGEVVWIIEGDDFAEEDFLSSVLPVFESHEVVFSASASSIINQTRATNTYGNADFLSDTIFGYGNETFVVDAKSAIEGGFAYKNPLLNVGSVIFRRETLEIALERCLADLASLRKSQDWRLYLELLRLGRLAFHSSPKIWHRRHSDSVISSSSGHELLDEALSIYNEVQKFDNLEPSNFLEKRKQFVEKLRNLI